MCHFASALHKRHSVLLVVCVACVVLPSGCLPTWTSPLPPSLVPPLGVNQVPEARQQRGCNWQELLGVAWCDARCHIAEL